MRATHRTATGTGVSDTERRALAVADRGDVAERRADR
jgi:hypothetical protein